MAINIDTVRPMLNAKGNAYAGAKVLDANCEIVKEKLKLGFHLEITDGKLQGEDVYADLYFTPAAMDNSLKRLQDCFKYEGGIPNLNRADFTDMPVQLSMKIDTYNGEERLKFSFYPPRKPLDDDEFARAVKMLGCTPAAVAPPVAAPAQPVSVKTVAEPIDEADLPF